MARPQDKETLLKQADEKFKKLFELIDSMTEKEQQEAFSFEGRDRNIRDVLAHLYEWHQLYIQFVQANQKGEKQAFLPAPYNWKNYGEMNVEFWEKHQATDYEEVRKLVKESHEQVIGIIEEYTNEELFTKKYYSWTGTTSLGSYSVSATSSHYDWALKIIRRFKKGK